MKGEEELPGAEEAVRRWSVGFAGGAAVALFSFLPFASLWFFSSWSRVFSSVSCSSSSVYNGLPSRSSPHCLIAFPPPSLPVFVFLVLFSSVFVSSFCFSRGCCWLRWQWQLVAVERKCSVPGGVAAAGKKMVSCPQCWAVPCSCFLRLRRGAGSCFSSMVTRHVAGRWWAEEGWWWRGQCRYDGGWWLREPGDSSCSFLSAATPSLLFFAFFPLSLVFPSVSGSGEAGLGLRWQRRLLRVQGKNGQERGMAKGGTGFGCSLFPVQKLNSRPSL